MNSSELLDRTRHVAEIHAAPAACWPALVKRLLDLKWTVEQTNAAVKAVIAAKPPRGYEKFFAVEKLQEMAATGAAWTSARWRVRSTRTEMSRRREI